MAAGAAFLMVLLSASLCCSYPALVQEQGCCKGRCASAPAAVPPVALASVPPIALPDLPILRDDPGVPAAPSAPERTMFPLFAPLTTIELRI